MHHCSVVRPVSVQMGYTTFDVCILPLAYVGVPLAYFNYKR